MNADQAEDMRAQTTVGFSGRGIEVALDNDLLKIISPVEHDLLPRLASWPGNNLPHLRKTTKA